MNAGDDASGMLVEMPYSRMINGKGPITHSKDACIVSAGDDAPGVLVEMHHSRMINGRARAHMAGAHV